MKSELAPFYSEQYLKYKPISLEKKNVIALIVEKNEIFSPCAYIRIILPCFEKYRYQPVVIKCIDIDELVSISPDLIITHRTAIRQDQLSFFLEYVEKNNIPYFYDLDDDLLGIGNSKHSEANHYLAYSEVIKQLIVNASQVTVSTEHLKLKVEAIRSEISVVKNRLFNELWSHSLKKPKSNKLEFNVLYMGTTTHSNDLEMIDEALRKLKLLHSNILFNIIGVTSERENKRHLNFIKIPIFARKSYPLFVFWLKSLKNFDLGLAPLVNNDFNNSKSNIKCLEYCALRMPVIASNVIPYNDTLEGGTDCLLVDNTVDSWLEAILSRYEKFLDNTLQ